MKRPNADEITRWLNDDTLVAQRFNPITEVWMNTDNPFSWFSWFDVPIRISIATVDGKPVFEGDTAFIDQDEMILTGVNGNVIYTTKGSFFINQLTLTPPKSKTILDSQEFERLLVLNGRYENQNEAIKQFIRDNKDKI